MEFAKALHPETVLSFKVQINALTEQLHNMGCRARAYTEDSLEHFGLLGLREQERVLRQVRDCWEIYCFSAEKRENSRREEVMLWYALRSLGLRPCGDIFERIGQGDVVEVYNPDFIQIYRNNQFFNITGYSVADIFTHTWIELYERDAQITESITAAAIQLFSNQITSTLSQAIPEHTIREAFSPEKRLMRIKVDHLSPLFDSSGRVAAVIAVSNVEVLAKEAVRVEPDSMA